MGNTDEGLAARALWAYSELRAWGFTRSVQIGRQALSVTLSRPRLPFEQVKPLKCQAIALMQQALIARGIDPAS